MAYRLSAEIMGAAEKIENTRLWDSKDCARYTGCARWIFVNRINKEPTFSKPYIEMSRRMRRWLPDDVKEWNYRKRDWR